MTAHKLVRYFFTAGIASLVDIGGFAVLCAATVPVPAAAVTSFCVAAAVNYLLSSRFAFHQPASLQGFGRFFLAALGGLVVNVLVTLASSYWLGLPPVLAKVAGVGTSFLLNFWINLKVVFLPAAVRRDR